MQFVQNAPQSTNAGSPSRKHAQQAVRAAGELRKEVQASYHTFYCSTFADLFSAGYRALYKFGRTLGAGTYGIVREADGPDGQKVAVKIILKKNVRGNEGMVHDELEMLQSLQHPHIVSFVDWFESKVSKSLFSPIVAEL